MEILEVTTQDSGGHVTVSLNGELDLSSVGKVEEELERVEKDEPTVLVLDLSKLSFLDSTGLRAVVTADGVDAIVDATGAVEYGCHVVTAAIEHGKHVILMNAEVDATVGPILAEKARAAGDRSRARELLDSALALWDGEPLAGLAGPYADTQRTRLDEWRLSLMETRFELELELGCHAEAVSELTALTARWSSPSPRPRSTLTSPTAPSRRSAASPPCGAPSTPA